ncbi:MAG: methyltransferase domain-containing protein [Alphaproteobacteria bacterium]|nr:methyltransferase domain-containing protein [Alphaproteobacteria bacterium]MCY4498742.1 methyltransferase domain-containing protein [Rhodospirillaceae bacterium]
MDTEISGLPVIFDRAAVRTHRDRAARSPVAHDFLIRESAERLLDRLEDVTRQFPRALDLGCRTGTLARILKGRGGIESVVHADLSWEMVRRISRLSSFGGTLARSCVVADEELLPFAPESFDIILSNLSLHWTNDLPGTLAQLNRALKPDGLFLATMFGGDTLWELREALLQAEAEFEGGAGPRVSPFVDVRDAGDLLNRARFALSVADVDSVTVTYPDMFRLMADLRGMGETNAARARRQTFTRRETLMRADTIYRELHGDEESRLPATFQIIALTGWAPHASQPKPRRPGSATTRLADALGTTEQSVGDKAKPA